mmetsp:Transcript_22405/g.52823  ORF Transcript_22405/g.52823 Transcript_22405/m.52823 type:complete len:850 (-) Transcript_22405:2304-4853(-)
MTPTKRSSTTTATATATTTVMVVIATIVIACYCSLMTSNSNTGGIVLLVADAFVFPKTPSIPTVIGTPFSTCSSSSSSIIRQRTPPSTTTPVLSPSSPSSSTTTALFGIPKMFRYLTDQYPDIVTEIGLTDDVKVDNLYLDMNGIIHPCTHGNSNEDGTQIMLDETAMFKKIFLYVDRLYKLVKPTNVLYLAVDGVAPRAKMNQQRSRRFRSAKEAEKLASSLESRDNFTNKGKNNSNENDAKSSSAPAGSTVFDSNCITPGTDFMLKLSLATQKWVEYKQKTDPFWQEMGVTVVVSGPDVPGEGEHKVMDYLRAVQIAHQNKKKQNGDAGGDDDDDGNDDDKLPIDAQMTHYDPNLTHVLYGLDADLIMLGLVTHEPNFMLLREKMSVVMAGRGRNKYRKRKDVLEYNKYDFEILELKQLRKLFAIQFRQFVDVLNGGEDGSDSQYSLERILDDFVFMCMMVGNDFLPHCPHLEIDGGAINLMTTTYIDLLPEWGGYLTDKEKINPDRFESFLYHISVYEEEHFKRRGREEGEPGWSLSSENEEDDLDFYGTYYSGDPTPACAVEANFKESYPPPSRLTSESAEGAEVAGPKGRRDFRRRHANSQARSYRDFYYESKLGWKTEDRERTLFNRRAHVRDYLEGLHWNLNYYHNGCASWEWYFPHLYSPLATDMVNLDEFYNDDDEEQEFRSFKFDQGEPFPSLGQLLSVLPPQSASLLPPALGELMLKTSSPLIPYYPKDFKSDPNGKRQPWEAVVDLPFIDADLLLDTVQDVLNKDDDDGGILSPSERRRNARGKIHVFHPEPIDSDGDVNRSKPESSDSAPKRKQTSTKKSAKRKSKAKSKEGAPRS